MPHCNSKGPRAKNSVLKSVVTKAVKIIKQRYKASFDLMHNSYSLNIIYFTVF